MQPSATENNATVQIRAVVWLIILIVLIVQLIVLINLILILTDG